jgi:hypothetical protein
MKNDSERQERIFIDRSRSAILGTILKAPYVSEGGSKGKTGKERKGKPNHTDWRKCDLRRTQTHTLTPSPSPLERTVRASQVQIVSAILVFNQMCFRSVVGFPDGENIRSLSQWEFRSSPIRLSPVIGENPSVTLAKIR